MKTFILASIKKSLPNSVKRFMRDSVNRIKKVDDHKTYLKAINNRNGLEIGGPLIFLDTLYQFILIVTL